MRRLEPVLVDPADTPVAIEHIAISRRAGEITLAGGDVLARRSLNGDLLGVAGTKDEVTRLGICEGPEWSEQNAVQTDHDEGVIRMWSLPVDRTAFELRRKLRSRKHTTTALYVPPTPTVRRFFSGTDDGSLVQWSLSQGT